MLILFLLTDAQWTHCVIHREALASKQLSPDLNEILNEILRVLIFIKTRPLKVRQSSTLWEQTGADQTAVLFQNEARWHSRVEVLLRVLELRVEIRLFLEEERMYESASKYTDEHFLTKLAYLSDVFGKLNELTLQIQGKDKPLPHLADKITGFTKKPEVWDRRLERHSIDAFENLSETAKTSDPGATLVKQNITLLLLCIIIYILSAAPADFNSAEQDQFIELTSDSTLRLNLQLRH